ncbi:MAG: glucose-6-phosphate isomerase [Acidobacteria bacterium]|nr:glucose-6-phosphate isomerase [Acidobacteriota bacterium]
MHSARDLLSTRWPALGVAAKRARLQDSFHLSAGPLSDAITAHADAADRAAAGLARREPSAWSREPVVQQKIANRLGWLDSPILMADSLDRLQAFADAVKRDGFTDIVLLGMGGSSLAPEVLRAVLGVAPGWPRLHVVDSTDPAAVLAAATPPEHTLYLVASKSGTTIEPNVLAAHFRRVLENARGPRWSDHFVAITDEDTALANLARAERYREVFINPADIGGRYSALSLFGLVPAALMGQNVSSLVGWGLAMLAAAEPGFGEASSNPAVALGLLMGAAARSGRDKLTLILPAALEPFGLWVEQLVAESTGKNGRGVVPIAGEPIAEPVAYGTDRLFVRLRLHGSFAEEMRDTDVRDLKTAGAPVAEIELAEPSALGAEFVRWEVATAIAGALLQINPFDEPNVQQAKDAARALLDQFKSQERLPVAVPDSTLESGAALTLTSAARAALDGRSPEAILTLLRASDYFALLAYVGPDPELAGELRALRIAVRDRTRAATMFSYGPRYLHSTGQLHKGGPNTGVFVLMTSQPRADVPIPGEAFSFGTLELAQALGDFVALDAAGRRALHLHLPSPDRVLVRRIGELLLDRLPRTSGDQVTSGA